MKHKSDNHQKQEIAAKVQEEKYELFEKPIDGKEGYDFQHTHDRSLSEFI